MIESRQRQLNKTINREFERLFKTLDFNSKARAGVFFVYGMNYVIDRLMSDTRYTASKSAMERQFRILNNEVSEFKEYLAWSLDDEHKRGG